MAKCKKSIDQIIECICNGSISSYAELKATLANTDFSVQQKSDLLEQYVKYKLDNCQDDVICAPLNNSGLVTSLEDFN